MNLHFPVFTTENICHDCYKCIRHCPCKAIRIVDGRAGVLTGAELYANTVNKPKKCIEANGLTIRSLE